MARVHLLIQTSASNPIGWSHYFILEMRRLSRSPTSMCSYIGGASWSATDLTSLFLTHNRWQLFGGSTLSDRKGGHLGVGFLTTGASGQCTFLEAHSSFISRLPAFLFGAVHWCGLAYSCPGLLRSPVRPGVRT